MSPSAPPPPSGRLTAVSWSGSEAVFTELDSLLSQAVAQTCPHWLRGDRDDLVQTALIRVVEALKHREGNVELSTFYLRRAAYSAVIDEIRRRRRRGEVPLEDEEGAVERPSRDPGPAQQAAGRELGRAIRSCLDTMNESRRQAVVLRLQGHAVADVGRLLGWVVKKAENLVYRGMADLRGCLEDKGFAP